MQDLPERLEHILTTEVYWWIHGMAYHNRWEGEIGRPSKANNCGCVSKYMYFCNANSINTSCAHDAEHFNKYLMELKDAGLTCSGILVKILRVRNFLDFSS